MITPPSLSSAVPKNVADPCDTEKSAAEATPAISATCTCLLPLKGRVKAFCPSWPLSVMPPGDRK